MLSCFDFIRESTTLAMALRLLLAFICGAVIGAEREIKRRPVDSERISSYASAPQ